MIGSLTCTKCLAESAGRLILPLKITKEACDAHDESPNRESENHPDGKPKTIDTRDAGARKLTRKDVKKAAARNKNWGRWGKDDEIGTLNFTTAKDIVAAAQLVRKGKVMSLALNFDQHGPQGAKSKYPALGRFNPIHLMTRTGTDAYSGVLDHRNIRGTDDIIIMPLQCGTQWDGLGHILYEDYMWNGYDCRNVTSAGAQKAGIEKTKEKMVGRGVLLDVARAMGEKFLPDGFAITNEILDYTEAKQGVEVRRGDYVLVHTGHIERCLTNKSWDGYSGAMRRASRSRPSTGCTTRRLPALRPTRGARKCGRTRPKTPTSRGTGSRSR